MSLEANLFATIFVCLFGWLVGLLFVCFSLVDLFYFCFCLLERSSIWFYHRSELSRLRFFGHTNS